MKKYIIAFAVASLPAALSAQNTGTAFQYVFTNGGGTVSGGPVMVNRAFAVNGKVVTGHPVAAVEERHSLQILSDGTRIENKSSDKFYRDDMGRTRTEREDGSIMIDDPVSGTGAEINANGRVTRRTISKTGPGTSSTFSYSSEYSNIMADTDKLKAEAQMKLAEAKVKLDKEMAIKLDKEIAVAAKDAVRTVNGVTTTSNEIHNEENLGLRVTNGISAEGTRNTTTIPAGQIGNDRPISVVSERWYSPDLQMLIRSTNNDPRFGETSYELTNIITGTVDPTLFTIPAGKLGESARPNQ